MVKGRGQWGRKEGEKGEWGGERENWLEDGMEWRGG